MTVLPGTASSAVCAAASRASAVPAPALAADEVWLGAALFDGTLADEVAPPDGVPAEGLSAGDEPAAEGVSPADDEPAGDGALPADAPVPPADVPVPPAGVPVPSADGAGAAADVHPPVRITAVPSTNPMTRRPDPRIADRM